METISIQQTGSTPQVLFDPLTSTLRLLGESYPENSFDFYTPVVSWLKSALQELSVRIRGALEKAAIIHNGGELFITVSIGVSEYRAGDTRETLLQRADQAMYTAKESGRNKVCQA